jgi:hypothetical protein
MAYSPEADSLIGGTTKKFPKVLKDLTAGAAGGVTQVIIGN